MKITCIEDLRSLPDSGKLSPTSFKSRLLLWTCYLSPGCNSLYGATALIKKERNNYNSLKRLYLPDKNTIKNDLDPLSFNEDGAGNEELKKLIRQDVERTFPDEAFFRKNGSTYSEGEEVEGTSEVQDMMCDILLVYCKQQLRSNDNEDSVYRQGFHEILGIIIFLVYSASQSTSKVPKEKDLECVHDLFQPEFIEHDAFYLFTQIIKLLLPFYSTGSLASPKKLFDESALFKSSQDSSRQNTPLAKILRNVQNVLLKRLDSELSAFLSKDNIEPQIYGIRWIRLLFSREFVHPLKHIYQLWDNIFSYAQETRPNFEFCLECVSVVLLLELKQELLKDDLDTSMILRILMKYPRDHDPVDIARKAKDIFNRYANAEPSPIDFVETPKSLSRDDLSVNNKKSPNAFLKSVLKNIATSAQGVTSLTLSGSFSPNQTASETHKIFSSNSSFKTSEQKNMVKEEDIQQRLKGEIYHVRSIQRNVQDAIKQIRELSVASNGHAADILMQTSLTSNTPVLMTSGMDSELDKDILNPWSSQPSVVSAPDMPTVNQLLPSSKQNGSISEASRDRVIKSLHEADEQLDNLVTRLEDFGLYITQGIAALKQQQQVQLQHAALNVSNGKDISSHRGSTASSKQVSVDQLMSEVESFSLPVSSTLSPRSTVASPATSTYSSGAYKARSKQLEDLLK